MYSYIGGNEYGEDYRDLVDILDTTTGVWESQPAIPAIGRASLGCLTTEYNGEMGLMITGGCSNGCQVREQLTKQKLFPELMITTLHFQDHLVDSYFFSYASKTWETLPSLTEERMGHGMTHIDGYPAVIGGYNSQLLDGIELWDGANWIAHPDRLTYARWAYGMPAYVPMADISC